MARVPFVRSEDIPDEYADIAARKINIYRVAAHNLEGARSFSQMGRYLKNSDKLDPRLREMVTLQVGYLCHCAYEFYHHVKIGYKAGMTDVDVRAVIAETAGEPTQLNDTEKAALKMARQLTRDVNVDDETFALLSKRLPVDALVDLVMTIGHYNSAVRFLNCFEVELEEGYESLVEKFPMSPAPAPSAA
jgi:4-carboxymuconolactone decarboxylase